ncbi:MAG: hypothetical protein C5B50_13120 [Verrucomicrobia bacterium]|nr:MAG: hypothetical protein C5B50_13120 [Verrucomicrobiota bacterium]
MKRDPLRGLILTLSIVCGVAISLPAAEQPPDEAFHSTFEFQFRIPDSFKAVKTNRGYLETPTGRAPYLDHVWKRETESIYVRAFVVPKSSWEASTDQMFAGAKQNMLTDPKLKLVSERDYSIGGCPAHSFLFVDEGDDSKSQQFQRMDYILTKPDLNIVAVFSPQKAFLEDKACTELFKSISIRPKTSVNKPQTPNK